MRSNWFAIATTAVLLGALPLAAGHDEDMNTNMAMNATAEAIVGGSEHGPDWYLPNYFHHPHRVGWMYSHIALTMVGWTILLPVSIMLSVARSRYHLPAQMIFHVFNGLGMLTGFVYSHATPDLYERNSHKPLGWIVTSFTVMWTITSIFVAYCERTNRRRAAVSEQNLSSYGRFQRYRDEAAVRYSRDSGHGTDSNSTSLLSTPRQGSQDSLHRKPEHMDASTDQGEKLSSDDESDTEKHGLLGKNKVNRFLDRYIHRFASPKLLKGVQISQIIIEKVLLLLGFAAIATGFVIYGGVFRSREVFSGAAHFFKGGIFFWYGLLTLGRWMGAFSEFGWAWNIRPEYPLVSRWKSRVPSAEFTESFVIWLYGASNVFMEHMNNWGKAWSPQDFEHVSITLLFFGGGLLGMVIESSWARELMNTTIEVQKNEEGEVGRATAHFRASDALEEPEELWAHPETYKTSFNPMPGLVIMLLGVMMSSHHQESMVSTMMHSQWGSLFAVFAMARAVTYIVLYIKPPTSHFPARPPSELVAAFCLTAGGLMFMMSARGTVEAIEYNGLDAMAIFTVTLGLAGVILAWEVLVFAMKGWAVRKEHAAVGRPLA